MLFAAFLLCFLFGCHGSILPFPFFMEFHNDILLQLIEVNSQRGTKSSEK